MRVDPTAYTITAGITTDVRGIDAIRAWSGAMPQDFNYTVTAEL